MMYFLVAVGFVLLLGGAEFLVRGAVAVARRLGVSPLVIGMTVVAFGTSAPELVVSMDAAISGAPGLALGNVIGSNIANVLLILGAASLVRPIMTRANGLSIDAMVLMAGSLLFFTLPSGGDTSYAGLCWTGAVGVWQGTLLVAMFCGFLGYSYWREVIHGGAGAEHHIAGVEEIKEVSASPWLS